MATMQNIKNLILVYTDEEGNSHEQYASDLIESGTLIDAETGDDMVLVGFKVIDPVTEQIMKLLEPTTGF